MEYDYLNLLFAYNPETGALTWKVKKANRIKIGSIAGTIGSCGYRYVRVDGKVLAVHRIVWTLMTYVWPTQEIDHINRNPADNCWTNLRLATASQNCINRHVHSSTNFRGVSSSRDGQKHYVQISVEGIELHSARYHSEEDAARAYDILAKALHGDFAQLNFPEV